MSRGKNMIRKDSDVADLTEHELFMRIGFRLRQVRRLEKELKILRRVHDRKRAALNGQLGGFAGSAKVTI